MKKAKRFLSVLLVLCMFLGTLPSAAYAAGSNHPFTDVNDGDWFNSSVEYVYHNGLMNGTGSTAFSPYDPITRGQMVTILHRLDGTPSATGASFTDVPAGEYYASAVAWASANGIMGGYGGGLFGPADSITREQMAATMYRYAQYKGYDTTDRGNVSSFSDGGMVSSYAVEAVNWAIGSGLFTGVGDNMFAPADSSNRAQAATILMRFCENTASSGGGGSYHTVTFDYNYDGKGTYSTATVENGKTVSSPANPTRSGYTFDGWYTAASGGSKFNFGTAVTSDLTLYAHWTVESSGGGSGGGGGGSSGSQPRMSIQITNNGYNEENSSLVTQEDSIALTGVVSGANASGVTVVYAGYGKENISANVSGTNIWTANIPLEIGTNTVTVKATGAGSSAEKIVYINRTSEEITYKETVKIADEEDYQTIADGIVACWVDDNKTPDDENDDYIVMLAVDNSLLMSQISEGLLNQGDVYMIPQNDIFLTGFTGIYTRHQAPRGTDNYPLESYSDDGYEEIIFDYPSFADLFGEDISLDFSGGFDLENPVAFAVLADGTPVDISVEYGDVSDFSAQIALYNNTGIMPLSDIIGNPLYPRAGWQPEELIKNILPSAKCSSDTNNRVSLTLNWNDIVIYDDDGVKNTGAVDSGQLKLSGEVGIKNIAYKGGMEWHPSLVPWDIQLLPQQIISKLSYNYVGSLTLKGETNVTTAELVKALNGGFDNKAEFWGMSLSGVNTFKTKWVVLSAGLSLTPPCATFATTIKGQSAASTLTPMLVLYVFIDVDGNLSVEGSIAFKYTDKVEKGFNIQKNGYTGAYGSQAQNRSENHYTIGSDYTLDVYNTDDTELTLTFGGKAEASLDLGIGAGACLMIGGFAPASIDGEVFYRASGEVEAEGEVQFYPELGLDGSFYAGIYQGLGVKAKLAAKILLKTKIGSAGFDVSKEWEHMFWEKNWSTSKLDGTVYVADADADNTNNEKISGAKVTLTKQDTNRVWMATTDDQGKYEIKSIPDGKYTIKVEKTGYDTYTNDNLIFSKQQTLNVFLNRQAQQPGVCSLSGKILIADDDTDLTNNAPLEGARIDLVNLSTNASFSTNTLRDGTYKIENLSTGNYQISISKAGYITVLEAISIADNIENYYNATVEAISEEYLGNGTASGSVFDALTGVGVPGLTLNIRDGINIVDGTIKTTISTGADGSYITPFLPAGNYSVQVVDERTLSNGETRYLTSVFTIKILGNHSIPNQDGYVTNGLQADQLRIVLKWGENPGDLDSHLVGPATNGGQFHTYYSSKNYYSSSTLMANLDLDDMDSYGPETTTIYEMTPGVYTFIVHDYTNRYRSSSTVLANSGAYVEVYLGVSTSAAYTFHVPSEEGTLWTVFSYDSNTGIIQPINVMSYHEYSSTVGSNYSVDSYSLDSLIDTQTEKELLYEEPLKGYEIAEHQNEDEEDISSEEQHGAMDFNASEATNAFEQTEKNADLSIDGVTLETDA